MPEPIAGRTAPWLHERARRDPQAPAIRFGEEELSFGALADRAEAAAARLAALGVGAGDRVAVVLESSLRFVELVHAVQRLGATLVPVDTRLTPSEVGPLLDDVEPRVVLFGAEKAALAGANAPCIEARRELDAVRPVSLPPPAPLDPAGVHSILFTSGTTGRSKGVMLTNASHLASAAASRRNLGARAGDRWLALLPLHHVGGLSILLRSVIDGAPLMLERGFDPLLADRSLREGGVTLVSMVPTMLLRLLEETEPAWRRLRCMLLGGGPIPVELVRRAEAAAIPVAPTYGLTEAASQVATMPPGEAGRRPGSSGRPLPGTEVRIGDPDREGRGEILVRGPTVMAGYFRQPEATRAALRDGWLHTGDIGHVDDDGCLYVHDRRSDLIVSGGENVYPAEVEAALLAHSDVAEAAVYPEPDPHWGQRVAAAVVLRPGARPEAEALLSWCASRLARFKLPRSVAFVEALPKTASGKIRRRATGHTAP